MKRLSHKNIVKYIDVISTDKYLNIVLEYIENGSLSGIIKKYSAFKEHLVAFFISQVLQGLKYLHSQGVVHRDIKGANLLTTKEGTVKLADFGVAMKLTESTKNMSIVGTPYWMAPEIVEQTGRCSTSCDIWSLGCTVIELLTTKPPYYDLEPMSALYRIVQDDYPPLPPNLSNELKDFLIKCFQKEPFFRKSAQDLLEHPWLSTVKNKNIQINEDIQTQESDEEQVDCINTSITRENIKVYEESKLQDLSTYSENNAVNALRELLNKSFRNQSVDEHKKSLNCTMNEDLESEQTELDHTELDSLIEILDLASTPKNLHKALKILTETPCMKKYSISIMPILKQILDENEDFESLHLSLQLTNSICDEPGTQEIAASMGLLASALKYIGEEFCKELRIEAAFLIGQFFQSNPSVLRLMLASGGLEATVKLLDPNFIENKELVVLGIDCLISLIEDSGKEYLRLWAMHGAIERLALALDNLSTEPKNIQYTEKVADLLLVFSTGCNSILFKFCEEDVLSIIISALNVLPETPKIQVLTALKNLAAHRDLQYKLENAGFIVDVVKILKNEKNKDVKLACILILNSLCKLSPARQEQAVLSGAIPVLLEELESQGKIQSLSISLLCSFVSASTACRSFLHKYKGLDSLIKLLKQNMPVFDCIATWTSYEPQRCEDIILQDHNIDTFINVFVYSISHTTSDEAIQCMIKILRNSDKISKVMANRQDFLQGLYSKLNSSQTNASKAKNCLDLLLVVTTKHPKPRLMMDQNKFYPLIVKILHSSRDEDLVVIEEITTLLLSIYSSEGNL